VCLPRGAQKEEKQNRGTKKNKAWWWLAPRFRAGRMGGREKFAGGVRPGGQTLGATGHCGPTAGFTGLPTFSGHLRRKRHGGLFESKFKRRVGRARF